MSRPLQKYSLFLALFCALAFSGLMVLAPLSAVAQQRTPLLMEGKKTLFQRIIVHPGAKSYAQPPSAGQAEGAGKAVKPFSVFYVYGSKNAPDGSAWLEVSPSTSGQNLVWIPQSLTASWKQSLTLLFTERMGRQPRNAPWITELASILHLLVELAKLGNPSYEKQNRMVFR